MENKTIAGCPSGMEGVIGTDGSSCTCGITTYKYLPLWDTSIYYNYFSGDPLYRIKHNDNQIDINVLLPEVKMEDIKLLVEDNVLIIKFLNDKKYTFFNLCLPEFKIIIDSDYELKSEKNAVLQAGVLSLSLTEVRHIKSIKITEG